MIGLGVKLPVWTGKYRNEELSAREAALAAEAAKEHVENLAVYRVLELHVRVETALREVKLYRDVVLPKARQTLGLLESAYAAGKMEFLRLMDAERALERYELAEKQAVTEFESRFADLERAVGRPLKETRE
jgi:outer membrane protein TolC